MDQRKRYEHNVYKLPRTEGDQPTHSPDRDTDTKVFNPQYPEAKEGIDFEFDIVDRKSVMDADKADHNARKAAFESIDSATTVPQLKSILKHMIKHQGLDKLESM